MRKIAATIIISLVIFSTAFSVTYATTDAGKTIVLNDNGTWKYFEPGSSESFEFPLGKAYMKLQLDKYGSLTIRIGLRNLSPNSIKAFEYKLLFFDDFKRRLNTIYDEYSIQRVSIKPGEVYFDIWDPPAWGNPVTVHGFPTIIIFEDDSMWELSEEQREELEAQIMNLYESGQ